jgi:hypothetical protein
MRISLIANSSIQYYKFKIDLNDDFGQRHKLIFREPYEGNIKDFYFDPLFKYENQFYRKNELVELDALTEGGLVKKDYNLSVLEVINEAQVQQYNNINTALNQYKKHWIPLPLFKDNKINKGLIEPTDWARCYIDFDQETNTGNVTIAIDTTLAKNQEDKKSPYLSDNPGENIFQLCDDPYFISQFIYHSSERNWLEKYLNKLFFRNEEQQIQKPFLKHIGAYILVIKWLKTSGFFPEFQICSDSVNKIPVDLVVDIGNSATCALLIENQKSDEFKFDRIKKLRVQDYTNPNEEYTDPFPMNLIFNESNFGDFKGIVYENNKFVLPSLVRIGFEAKKLIDQSAHRLDLGRELNICNSSPKRYLWDEKPSAYEWEFNPGNTDSLKTVSLKGITDQLKKNGELKSRNDSPGRKAFYSRKSLMKFVFLEIITHAYIQINSYQFRLEHGELTSPRTLKRIVVSCPTAMTQFEQIELRKAAEEACKLLNNYIQFYFDNEDAKLLWFQEPEIIPSVNDLKKEIADYAEKKDWNYDEATCSQLVFIYSLINQKLKTNSFAINEYLLKNKESIIVGSIDYGAGTTDVLVSEYRIKKDKKTNITEITPNPKFSDSFKLAGDDLINLLIHRLFLKSGLNDSVIQKLATINNISDIDNKLTTFFGVNSNSIGFSGRIRRKSFVQRVCIPFAIKCLEHANDKKVTSYHISEIIGLTIDETQDFDIIKKFEEHFGFEISNLTIEIVPDKVNEIIRQTFSSLIQTITDIFNFYDCDYIVLSGKPASLNSLETLVKSFINNYSDKLINLNKYWLGTWYPSSDALGYVTDPKTIVCVGAMISNLSTRNNLLKDFCLNTSLLKTNIVSNADYIITLDVNKKIELLSPRKSNNIFHCSLPFEFKSSKYLGENYPSSNLLVLDIDEDKIGDYIRQGNPNISDLDLKTQVDKKANDIRVKSPLSISISRIYNENKEKLEIVNVDNNEGESVNTKFLKLSYKTLEKSNYWLDSCEFIL